MLGMLMYMRGGDVGRSLGACLMAGGGWAGCCEVEPGIGD